MNANIKDFQVWAGKKDWFKWSETEGCEYISYVTPNGRLVKIRTSADGIDNIFKEGN